MPRIWMTLLLVAALAPAAMGAEDLIAQDRQCARRELERCGDQYVARIDHHRHIVYVSALDDEHFRQTAALLTAFTDAQRRTLLDGRPAWTITIVLPTADDYPRLVTDTRSRGVYYPASHRLVAMDRGRVMLHEFTHALHHADMAARKQVHPMWVSEGLATLFEACQISPSGLEPVVESSLLKLQKAIRQEQFIPLEELLKMGPEPFMASAEVAYPEARYLMLYLWDRDRLKLWYRRYTDTYADDPTGRKALEAALGQRIYQIEDALKEWVMGLKLPLGELRNGQARLGLEVVDDERGVKVVGLVDGSAAKQAGRVHIGDIVTSFNGQKIKNPAVLVAAVRSAGALQTVTVELIRHGRPMTVQQPLGTVDEKLDGG